MQDNTKIYFWSPFIGNVGTVKNVINTAYSLVKFPKKKIFEITLINVFGEWNFAKNNVLKRNILIKDFYSINFFLNFKKEGFLRSRLSYVFIFNIVYTFIKYFKEEKPKFLNVHLLTTLPFILYSIFNFETKLILSIAGYSKIKFSKKVFMEKNI